MNKKSVVNSIFSNLAAISLSLLFFSCLPQGQHASTLSANEQNSLHSEFLLDVLSPAENSEVSGLVAVTGFCLPQAWIKIEGSLLKSPKYANCSAGGTFLYQLETSANEGQSHLIITSGYEGEKESVRVQRKIILDRQAPTLFLTNLSEGTSLVQNQLVSGSCESPFDVQVTGQGLAAPTSFACTNNRFEGRVIFNNSALMAQLQFKQKDRAGNETNVKKNWNLDLGSDSLLSIAQPMSQQYFSNQVQLAGDCEGSQPVKISVTQAQYQAQVPCSAGMYSTSLTSAFKNDGSFTIVVSQRADGSDSQAVSVIRDSVKPVLSFVSPQAGTQYSKNLIVSGLCETGSAVNISGDFMPGATKVNCVGSQFSTTFSLANLSGTHQLMLSQTDFAGNFNTISTNFAVMTTSSGEAADGLALYANNCAGCHGAVANSTKKGRSVADINIGIMYVGGMKYLKVLTPVQLEAIASVLNPQLPPPNPSDPDPTPTPTNSPYMCRDGEKGVDRTRKLTVREYQQTILDLFEGEFSLSDLSRQIGKIPDDRKRHGFDTEDNTVSGLAIEGYFDVAGRIGDLLRANTARLANIGLGCSQSSIVSDPCALGFINGFGRKALRRPLSSDESNRYFELFRVFKSSVSEKIALTYVVEAFIQSPEFLYHIENQGLTASSGRYQLSAHELASRISYLVTGTMPDQQLFAAASANQLSTPAQRASQVNRLLMTSRAKNQIKNYYEQWFGLNRLKQMHALPDGITGITTAALSSQAKTEIYSFMDNLIWNQGQNVGAILTDSTAHIESPAMAALYGIQFNPDRKLASTDFLQVYEAEQFSMKTSVGSTDAGGFSIWSENENIAERLTLPAGNLQFKIRARRQASGTVPNQPVKMDVYIDSQAVASIEVGSDSATDYNFNYIATQGSHLVQIVFRGDYYSQNPAGDLNLWVDSLTVQSESNFAPMTVSLASVGRAGLLTRAGFLVSGENHSNPIVRGVEVLKDIQCVNLAPPDASDPALQEAFTPVAFDAKKTNRERIAQKTSPQQCQVCHRQINPIGFAFENFGAFGEFQTSEINYDSATQQSYELPIDATTTALIDGQNANVMNAVELSQLLSQSTSVKMCAAEKLFTFAHGRKPTAEDECSLEKIYSAVMNSELSFKDYYRSVIEDPDFAYKRVQ